MNTAIILDVLSYRGSDDEQERIGVKDIIISKAKDEKDFSGLSKYQKLMYGIIRALLEMKDENSDLILYCQNEGKSYYDISNLIENYFQDHKLNTEDNNYLKQNNKIKIIIGWQSLFYYLGWQSSQIK